MENSKELTTPILMNAVESGNIRSIGYDPELMVLSVEFKDGKTYRYLKVPEVIYIEFYEHRSPGSFLHQQIKGKYECFKMEIKENRGPDQIGE